MTKELTQQQVQDLLEEGRKVRAAIEKKLKPKFPGDIKYSDSLRAYQTERKCPSCKEGRIEIMYSYHCNNWRSHNPDWTRDGSRCDKCGLCYDFRGLNHLSSRTKEDEDDGC